MISRTLIATLIIASAAFAFASTAGAGPVSQHQKPTGELSWMDRASSNYDGGGY